MYFEDLIYKDGVLWWSKSRPGRRMSMPAGNVNKCLGYRQIRIDGKLHYAHRIVWEMHNGDIPEGMEIDHIDGNRLNNKIDNLRMVTHQQNVWNTKPQNNKKAPLKGLAWCNFTKKWRVRLQKNSKYHEVGRFRCPCLAYLKYLSKAEHLYGEYANHVV